MTNPASKLHTHQCYQEPKLLFSAADDSHTHVHPLKGLITFGPYSRTLLNAPVDPLRVATIVPEEDQQTLKDLLNSLTKRHAPAERTSYLAEYPGFLNVFRMHLVNAARECHVVYRGPEVEKLLAREDSHSAFAQFLMRAVQQLAGRRADFDVIVIYLPTRFSQLFFKLEEGFDLHHYLKASCASQGIPIQIVREDKAVSYHCRCSVAWRLGIAMYCKAGGIPWTLASVSSDTAYIGISYAVKPAVEGHSPFVICCSQVFDTSGAGLEFVIYQPDSIRMLHDNPFMDRAGMRRAIARSLEVYQRQNGGRRPSRLVVHKSTEFKSQEIDGCIDEWQSTEGLELLHIQQNCGWRAIRIDPPKGQESKGTPAGYPCERGSCLPLSGREILLWTQGDAPSVAKGHYYKEGKNIPEPLKITRYAGHGGWDQCCNEVLGLTKMNWNNDGLYDRVPATMSYAHTLAEIIQRMSDLTPRTYSLRFFM